MLDDLYHRDAFAWSEHQAGPLRRVAREEFISGVDWENVIEEIESVGLRELHAVQSSLRLILVNLLKLHGWPGFEDGHHWRGDIVGFQGEAERRFAPSMRRRIDPETLYASAVRQIQVLRYGRQPALALPVFCPVTLDQLLTASVEDLEAVFSAQERG
jgi:hypothetical protein